MRNSITYLIILLFVFASHLAFAQDNNGKITGSLKDESGKPLDGASVSLINGSDSTLVKMALTDAKGTFGISPVSDGQYRLLISFIGYNKYKSGAIVLDPQHREIVLPAITLVAAGKVLNEVAVVGRKSFIENKIDRTIVNVNGNPATAGSNALEALGIAPGVAVGPDGGISLNGKSGVTVYIDDKPTYLSGNDLANYLRSLQASLVDKLEVIPNPPAKYDAAGTAGIIMIRLKKNKQAGFNGSVNASYSQGIYARTSETLNFNYHKDKINLFGSAGYTTYKRKLTSDLEYKYLDPNGSVNSTLLTNSVNINDSKTTNLRLGFDYAATKNTTLGILLNGSINNAPNNNDIRNSILNSSQQPDSSILANNFSENKKKNGIVNINFDHKFDSLGTDLSINLDYIKYHSNSDQTFRNNVYNSENDFQNQELLFAGLPADIDIYSVKADYTHPFKHGHFDFGAKTSFSNTNNGAAYFNVIDGQSLPDYTKTNTILYKENINSAYVNYDKSFARFEIQAGLRLENTVAKGHQLGNVEMPDSSFKRNYTNLFPTLFTSYKLDSAGNHQLVFSYGRRIRRPYYQDLNPFLFFIDKFTYSAGNPYLKPSFSHNFELAYRYKDLFSFKFIHTIANDFFYRTTERDGDIFTNRPANIGRYKVSGININANIPVEKWYNIIMFSEVVRDSYHGNLYQNSIDTSAYAFDVTIRNQFNFSHGWSAQVNGLYRSRRVEIQNVVHPFGYLDLGLSKKVLNGKGNLAFYAKDVLNILKLNQTIINVTQTSVESRQLFDTRVFSVSFTYNFGSSKNVKRRQDSNSTDAEKQRIKDSN